MVDSNTRQSKRTPVTLKVKFKSETLEQFIERYAVDVSQGGIFIRTKAPQPVGTQMKFEFQLRDGAPLIGGEGTVVWIRELDPARPAVAPGMGVRFDRLADGSTVVLERILNQKSRQSGAQRESSSPSRAPSFNEAPTRVAQMPLADDGSSETTPLPSPMPFHSDADEFPDEAFEEATKVRSVEELIAQTALGTLELPLPSPASSSPQLSPPPEPRSDWREHRDARDARAGSPFAEPSSQAPAFQPPAATPPFASPVASEAPREVTGEGREAPLRTLIDSVPPPVTAATAARPADGANTGRTLLGAAPPPSSPSLPLPSPQQGSSSAADSGLRSPPRNREPSRPPATAAPLPSAPMFAQPASPPESRMSLLIIALLCVLAAAVALVWFLWMKQPAPVESATPAGQAGQAGQAEQPGQPGQPGQAGSATTPPPMPTPPPVKTAETTISADYTGAKIEVLTTEQRGASPFIAKLVEGQKYDVRVTAPGYSSSDLTVIGGNDPKIAVKLDAKPRALEINSTPAQASVYLDGNTTRKSTPTTIELTAAQRDKKLRVMIRRVGFQPAFAVVTPEDFTEESDRMVYVINQQLNRATPTPKATPRDDSQDEPDDGAEPDASPPAPKPAEPKLVEPKPAAEPKPATEPKPVTEPKSVEPKPAEPKPAATPGTSTEPAPDWSK